LKLINKKFLSSYQKLNAVLLLSYLKNKALLLLYKILSRLVETFLLSVSQLNRYQPFLKFQSCNNSAKICRKTQENVTAHLTDPPKSQFTKFMHSLKNIKKSFYYGSSFVNFLKSFLTANCSQYILNIYVFLKIKSRTIFTFAVTALSKKTPFTFLLKKSTTEFNSSSFVFPSPVTKFHIARTQKFSFWSNLYQSRINRIFSTSWIFSYIWCYVVLKKIFSIVSAIITSISRVYQFSLKNWFIQLVNP